jgi:hypothetical protein
MSAKNAGKRSLRTVGVVLAAALAVLAAGCSTKYTPREQLGMSVTQVVR